MTAVLDNPFVIILMSVPLDNSEDKTLLNMITITLSPICVAFLKNCVQASKAVASGKIIVMLSSIRLPSISGISFAMSGFVIPKNAKTISIIRSL
jgi:hypothetical protein